MTRLPLAPDGSTVDRLEITMTTRNGERIAALEDGIERSKARESAARALLEEALRDGHAYRARIAELRGGLLAEEAEVKRLAAENDHLRVMVTRLEK